MENLVNHARRMVEESDMTLDAKMEVLGFLNLEEILKFQEYQKLEEQGLLHKAPLPNGTPIYYWQTNDVDEWFVYQDSYLYGVSEYYNGKLGEDFFVSEEECRNHSVS